MPVDDQISLYQETNRRFWDQTGYKPGQKLDMSDPTDREMAKVWMDILGAVRGYRDRATVFARKLSAEMRLPYVFVAVKPDGTTHGTAFDSRNKLDVQYNWATDQPEMYQYAAAFDFTTSRGPLRDQFSSAQRSKVDSRVEAALVALREKAKEIAERSPADVIGIAVRPTGEWFSPKFSSVDEARTWLTRVSEQPTWFTYAAYFDKTGSVWPMPVDEAVGRGRAPLPVAGW